MIHNLSKAVLAAGVTGAMLAASPALADYPERPITFILPWAAGGGADLGVRSWTPYLEKCLGPNATVVVVNKPGASGVLGVSELAAAVPDGYTIGQLNTPNYFTAPIAQSVPYTIDSMVYLGNIVGTTSTINVRADSPMKTLADLIEAAKTSEKPMGVGLGGLGGDDHLAILRFSKLAGVNFEYIPFGGGGAHRTALLGGHVDIAGFGDTDLPGYIDQIRTLGVAAEERSSFVPDAPTFKEQGYDLLAGSLHILGAPAGVPDDILGKLRGCIESILSDAAFQADAAKRSVPLMPLTAKEAEDYVRTQEKAHRELWATDPWVK